MNESAASKCPACGCALNQKRLVTHLVDRCPAMSTLPQGRQVERLLALGVSVLYQGAQARCNDCSRPLAWLPVVHEDER